MLTARSRPVLAFDLPLGSTAAAAASTAAATTTTTAAAVTAAAIVAITEVAAVVAAAAIAAAITQKAATAVPAFAAPTIDFGSAALGDFGARITPQIDTQIVALQETLDFGGVHACCLLQFLPAQVPLERFFDTAVLRVRDPLRVHFPSLCGKEGVSGRSFDISVTHNKRIHTHKVSDAHCLVLQVCSYRFESVA